MKKNKKDPFHQVYKIEKSFRHHLIEWSAAAFSLIGAVFNAKQFVHGFYLWIIANILWMMFAYKHRHWGLFVMNIVFMIINIVGIYTWL